MLKGVSCSLFTPVGWAGRHHDWAGWPSGVKACPHQQRQATAGRDGRLGIQPHPYAATHAELVAPLSQVVAKAVMGTETLTLLRRAAGSQSPRPSWLGTRSARRAGDLVSRPLASPDAGTRARIWRSWAAACGAARTGETAASGASVAHLIELAEFAASCSRKGTRASGGASRSAPVRYGIQ